MAETPGTYSDRPTIISSLTTKLSGRTKTHPRLSLVFPIYNESQAIPHLLARVDLVVAELSRGANVEGSAETLPSLSVEVLCVNDGSRDDSLAQLVAATQTRAYLRVINFSRNFGHQAAVTAGMHHATGDAVALLDADLQDPPELLAKMIARWLAGADVVYAVRTKREGESAFKKWTASQFYILLRRLTNVDIPADTGDFRLMDRRVVNALNQMNESHRFLRGMSAWVGFRQEPIYYERPARVAGETKYPLGKMLRFAMDALTSFSDAPLKLATNIGVITALFALLYGGITIVRYFTNHGEWQAGWASIIALLTFLSGIQLITLGLVGEYIGRIYDEVKRRPLYLIADEHNGAEQQPPPVENET
ncbi:MAG: glycosyltransferase family 2 protein [Akkermansiaceae bacterium]|nr:glycosyltransferase family 2 protein [Armatimonadota bacterium]